MNGAHDLGGKDGFAAINQEAENEEPIFHADWEKRALGLIIAAGSLGEWNIDSSRFARERQHPVAYLTNSYYENWLAGLETLLLESNIANKIEILTGKMQAPAPEHLQKKCLPASQVALVLKTGGPADKPTNLPQTFKPGDRVRVKLYTTMGHTRAPQYVRGHLGTINEYYGSHIFPDESAKGNRFGMHLYNVFFSGSELWGAGNSSIIHLDLWQDYLEKV